MSKVDAYTKLLLHCNGADASTTFTDETGKTVTRNGDAQIDTAQYKFRGASGLFDGTADTLTLAHSDDWNFGTGDWTIDFWMRPNGVVGGYTGLVSGAYLGGGGPAIEGWSVTLNATGDAYPGKPTLHAGGGGQPAWSAVLISSSTIPDEEWTHIAVVRSGNTVTMYHNGVSKGTFDCTGRTFNSKGIGVIVGAVFADVTDYANFNGHLDEIRVSKGIARWTAAFTPPTKEYGADRLFTFHG